MSAVETLVAFRYEDQALRTTTRDGEVWFVASDAAKILGHRDAAQVARITEADERGYAVVDTPGGPQQMLIVNESGLYAVVFRSRVEGAISFRRWVTSEVIPSIRRTGSYATPASPPRQLSRVEIARQLLDAEERAAAGVQFRRAIEAGAGLSVRAFHKKYFSAVTERAFNEHLYAKGYLIDQRGKGHPRPDGSLRDGPQHRHPGWRGKPWFYLHGVVGQDGGRHENARVIPGGPELELRDLLAQQGLLANETGMQLFEITGSQS